MYDSAPIIRPFLITSLGVVLHIAVFMAISFCVVLDESDVFLLCVVRFLYLFSVPVELDSILLLIVLFQCLDFFVSFYTCRA